MDEADKCKGCCGICQLDKLGSMPARFRETLYSHNEAVREGQVLSVRLTGSGYDHQATKIKQNKLIKCWQIIEKKVELKFS